MADQSIDARMKALEEKNAKLMAALEQKWEAQTSGSGIDAAQLERILTRVTDAAAGPSQVLASKLKPENADHEHKSAFEHPEGGIVKPKPALKRIVHWGRPLTTAELSYAEVLAANALSDSLARGQKRVARDGKWKAIVSDDDTTVTISVPVKTIDDRQDLPAFVQILSELTTGERALDQGDLIAELALVKAALKDLQSAHA